MKTYFQEVYTELFHKVTWPTRKDLYSSSTIVLIASCIIALMVFILDFSMKHLLTFVYSLFY